MRGDRPSFLDLSRVMLESFDGVGRSATLAGARALGEMTGSPVETVRSEVYLVPVPLMGKTLEGTLAGAVAALAEFQHAVPGLGILAIPEAHARAFAERLLAAQAGSRPDLDDLALGAIAGAADVTLDATLRALSHETGVAFSSRSSVTHREGRAIAREVAKPREEGDHALAVASLVRLEALSTEVALILLFFTEPRSGRLARWRDSSRTRGPSP